MFDDRIGGVTVRETAKDFQELQDKLERERILKVTHGGIAGEIYNMVTITFDPLADFRRDPIGMLRSIAKDAGYRMVDLFNDFDKDGNQYISKDEFIHGIKVRIIPILQETKMAIL
jgi:hypothetical protein